MESTTDIKMHVINHTKDQLLRSQPSTKTYLGSLQYCEHFTLDMNTTANTKLG